MALNSVIVTQNRERYEETRERVDRLHDFAKARRYGFTRADATEVEPLYAGTWRSAGERLFLRDLERLRKRGVGVVKARQGRGSGVEGQPGTPSLYTLEKYKHLAPDQSDL